VCSSPSLAEIDALLAGHGSMRAVARRYGITQTSIRRHAAAHLSPALVPITGEVVSAEVAATGAALDEVRDLVREAKAVLAVAKSSGNPHQQLGAINSGRALLELAARLTGELDNRPVTIVNVQQSSEWRPVREVVYEILSRDPEALAELDARLKELE